MKTLVAILSMMLVPMASAMTLKEAAQQLGVEDEELASKAQAVLRRGGCRSLGLLDEVIFTADGEAVERAKHCRRCILYDVPLKLPDQLMVQLTGFHRMTNDEQSDCLRKLAQTPFITSRTFACLHSRVAERNAENPILDRIASWLTDAIRQENEQDVLTLYDPRLIEIQTQAVVLNFLDRRLASPREVSTYEEWVKRNPKLVDLLDEKGMRWELERRRRAD